MSGTNNWTRLNSEKREGVVMERLGRPRIPLPSFFDGLEGEERRRVIERAKIDIDEALRRGESWASVHFEYATGPQEVNDYLFKILEKRMRSV